MRATSIAAALLALLCAGAASAQGGVLDQYEAELDVDSGRVVNDGAQRAVIWSALVHEPGAKWLRLRYDTLVLGRAPEFGTPTVLRITALEDGAVQTQTDAHVDQSGHTSVYFNGEGLLLEIIADPGALPSRLRVTGAWAGLPWNGAGPDDTCDGTDDRELSEDPLVCRTMPNLCTMFLIGDSEHCLLGAGHCTAFVPNVVQFNVPISDPDGSVNHPGPEDQYFVDDDSVQFQSQGLGDDWAYLGCFENSTTGLTMVEAQGGALPLADAPPPPTDQDVRITGYGTTAFPVPPAWNQAQKTLAGPYSEFIDEDNVLRYRVDTSGGNSGSPVVEDATGMVIGIHTNGGCDTDGFNKGTAINDPNLQNALANPLGICRPPGLEFTFPDGLPTIVAPSGASFTVEVTAFNGAEHEPDTGLLYFDEGGGFQSVPMESIGADTYLATFPALTCQERTTFYVSAELTTGAAHTSPAHAPDEAYETVVAFGIDERFHDDAGSDMGWSVLNSPDLVNGNWERGPVFFSVNGASPPNDADGNNWAYITDRLPADPDVDGGSTTLYSPLLDALDVDAVLEYDRWYSNAQGGDPMNDIFVIDISDDGGQSWENLETIGPDGPDVNGGWVHRSFVIADIPGIVNCGHLMLRFTVSDEGDDSLIEAGVDGIRIGSLACADPACAADLDGDAMIGMSDVLIVIGAWGSCTGCAADIDGDGVVDCDDLIAVLATWGPCD